MGQNLWGIFENLSLDEIRLKEESTAQNRYRMGWWGGEAGPRGALDWEAVGRDRRDLVWSCCESILEMSGFLHLPGNSCNVRGRATPPVVSEAHKEWGAPVPRTPVESLESREHRTSWKKLHLHYILRKRYPKVHN